MNEIIGNIEGPHQGQPVLAAGGPLETARAAMIMVHGRGATAESILELATDFKQPGFVYLAPQAAHYSWYPNSFLASIDSNEPGLSSGLAVIAALLEQLAQVGIALEKTILLGFSQGACLSLEFVARHAQRYGGVVGLSGGLIGPDSTPRNYPGSLEGTPVFLGCSDVDPHIPLWRVEETAVVMSAMDAVVTKRIYPGMGHTVNQDELDNVGRMMLALSVESGPPQV